MNKSNSIRASAIHNTYPARVFAREERMIQTILAVFSNVKIEDIKRTMQEKGINASTLYRLMLLHGEGFVKK